MYESQYITWTLNCQDTKVLHKSGSFQVVLYTTKFKYIEVNLILNKNMQITFPCAYIMNSKQL